MSAALVQQVYTPSTSAVSGTSITFTLPGTTKAGNLLILVLYRGSTSGTTSVAGCGATWTLAKSSTDGGTLPLDVWVGRNCDASSNTVTVTRSVSVSLYGGVYEFSGVDSSATTWTTAGAAASGTAFTSGSATPPKNARAYLAIGTVLNTNTETAQSPSITSAGWTELTDSAGGGSANVNRVAYKVVGFGDGAQAFTVSVSVSGNYAGCLVMIPVFQIRAAVTAVTRRAVSRSAVF